MRSAAAIEERLLVPAYASRWSSLSVAAHRVLAFPLQMRGPVRRRTFEVADRALTVLEVGRSKLTEPLVARLLGDLPPAASETARWLGDPGEAGAADLVLAEVHRWVAPRFRRAGWIVVPDQVRWRGELSALPPPIPSHSLKDDLRRVRSQGYTLEHASAPADWAEFAEQMVTPHASARFGPDAWPPSPYLWRQFAGRGAATLCRARRRPSRWASAPSAAAMPSGCPCSRSGRAIRAFGEPGSPWRRTRWRSSGPAERDA